MIVASRQRDGDAEAHLLEHDQVAAGETGEDRHDDQGSAGDDSGRRRDTERHRFGRVAALVVALLIRLSRNTW